jgi:hypothetical protein
MLVFDFSNGFYDAADSIATVVSIRVLTPRGSDLMLRRILLALSVSAVIVAPISAVQAAPPGPATPMVSSQPLGSPRWNDAYYLNHPLNGDRSILTARFLALRDTKTLFPATRLFPSDYDGWVSDYKEWTDTNISPNRRYYFVVDQALLHDPTYGTSFAKHSEMYCRRENLATHQVVDNYCNFKDWLTRIEYKECDPATYGCPYYNAWGTRNWTATNVLKAYFTNSLHSFGIATHESARARNPCMRARFLNPFSNPPWQSLHLTNWYKGTSGIVNIWNHDDQFINYDTAGMHGTSSSERAACDAAG